MGMLEGGFEKFLGTAPSDQSEFLLPDAVSDAMVAGAARVSILSCESEWFGMTSPGDRKIVEDRLVKLVENGVYPRNLWSA